MTNDTGAAPRAIIVISSHVVRGSVGNRAVVFALEHLGHPVWEVQTITLAWHPAMSPSTRIVPDDEKFASLLNDLAGSDRLGNVGAIVSGYLGSPAQAKAIAALVRAVKAKHPDVIYYCDPVVGDDGGLYVPQETAEAIRDELVPLADLTTPNRFELEWLSGEEVPDNATAMRVARQLGPQTTVVTSSHAMMAGSIGNLLVTEREAILAEHRAIPNAPKGTGDLFGAVLLARLMEGLAPEKALRHATAAVFEVVARAVKRGSDELMLALDADSLAHPMAMVQTRRLADPRGGRRA